MGCYQVICAVSNLPIKYRDPIVMIPVVQRKIGDGYIGQIINEDDLYRPITTPLYGLYNEYGFIEDIEEDANSQAVLETLVDRYPIPNRDMSLKLELKDIEFLSYADEYYNEAGFMFIHRFIFDAIIEDFSKREINFIQQKEGIDHPQTYHGYQKQILEKIRNSLYELERNDELYDWLSDEEVYRAISSLAIKGDILGFLLKMMKEDGDSIFQNMLSLQILQEIMRSGGYIWKISIAGSQNYESRIQKVIAKEITKNVYMKSDAKINIYSNLI